jgi:hypothetical protein
LEREHRRIGSCQLFKELPTVAAGCGFIPNILHTADPAAVLDLGANEAFSYTRKRIATPIPVPTKAAFLANTPVGVAIARNFENFSRNPNLLLRSFVSEDDALAWLVGDLRQAPVGGGAPNPAQPGRGTAVHAHL